MDDLDDACWTTVRESVLPCPDHDPLLFHFCFPFVPPFFLSLSL